MELKRGIVNCKEVEFVCESAKTRHGFKHTCTMFINGCNYGTNTCHYYNRTWERFKYETCMLGIVRKNLDYFRANAKENFKIKNGISKLTSKYKQECEDYINADTDVKFLTKIYNDISRTNNWIYR